MREEGGRDQSRGGEAITDDGKGNGMGERMEKAREWEEEEIEKKTENEEEGRRIGKI